MKKWILSVVIVVTNFLCAQSVAPVTGVPQFMGIPIEGDAVIFINKLKVKGFKVKKYDAIVTTMTGVFLGNVTNEVLIVHTPKSKKVWKVVVFLQEQIGWSSLKSEYQSLLSKLNNKYGEPSTSYFSFLSPYEEGDGGGMIIQSAHKNFKLRSGDWNQDQEAQYKYDMAWEALEKSGASVEDTVVITPALAFIETAVEILVS